MAPRRHYYDPGAAPKPRKPVQRAAPDLGPTGNSRQQRRQRARLSWDRQLALAASVGFPTPLPDIDPKMRAEWVAAWEAAYACQK